MWRRWTATVALGAVLWAGTAGQAVAGGWMDDWLASKTSTSGGFFEGSKRGYMMGGTMSARWPQSTDYLFTVETPRVNMGCGGIDLFMGGISFMGFDMLVKKLQNVLMSAATVSFQLALNLLCEPCSTIIGWVEGMNNFLNDMQMNDCAASTAIAERLVGPESKFAHSDIAKDIKEGVGNNRYWNWLKTQIEGDGGLLDPAKTKDLFKGCSSNWKKVILGYDAADEPEAGSLLSRIGDEMGIPDEHTDLIRGFIGDLMVYDEEKSFRMAPISPCPENNIKDIGKMLDGGFKVKTEDQAKLGQNCSDDTSVNQNIREYVNTHLNIVAAVMNADAEADGANSTTIGVDTIDFLSSAPLPVNEIMAVAVGARIEAGVIPVLSEHLSRMYMMAMMTDLVQRGTLAFQKVRELNRTAAAPAAGQDSTKCPFDAIQLDVDEDCESVIKAGNQALSILMESQTKGLAEFTQTLEMLARFMDLRDELMNKVRDRLTSSVALRVRGTM